MRKQAVITTFKSGLPSSLRAVAYAFQFPENRSVVPGNSNLKWTWMWKSLFYKCAPTSTIWQNSGRRFPLVRQKRNFISGREIIVGGREGKTSVVNDTMLQSYWTLWERTFSSSKNRWIPFRMEDYYFVRRNGAFCNLEILKRKLPLRPNIWWDEKLKPTYS